MPATMPKTRRPAIKRPVTVVKPATRKHRRPPLARPRPDIKIDMSRREAFLRLPLEERDRRLEAFRAAFAPAFADYSSDDFRADQRREAETDEGS